MITDLTGNRFGILTVVKLAVYAGKHSVWECLCDCGNIVQLKSRDVKRNRCKAEKSCGCKKDRSPKYKTHGKSRTSVYNIFRGIRQRCTDEKCKSWQHYGGRGIKLCDKWNTFEAFWADMGPSYSEGLQINRIDNDGDYTPENCNWVTQKQNANNKRNSVRAFGLTVAELSQITGVSKDRIYRAIRGGLLDSELFSLTEGLKK